MREIKKFARVNTRVTQLFKLRLQWACEKRERDTARRVAEGEILSEFANGMEPHPKEGKAAGASKKEPKRSGEKKRATPSKTASSKIASTQAAA